MNYSLYKNLIFEIRNKLLCDIKSSDAKLIAKEWFLQIIFLRYLEVNEFLPGKIRIFSYPGGAFSPPLLKEALLFFTKTPLPDSTEYKKLFLTLLHLLKPLLPNGFIKDFSKVSYPNSLHHEGGVLSCLVQGIPEEVFLKRPDFLGWLYQYFLNEEKNQAYQLITQKIKLPKNLLPAATQLFTPNWIIRYLVDNSLGRCIPNFDTNEAIFFLNEVENSTLLSSKPLEEITLLDPCMGSGHILLYAFDLLMNAYKKEGNSKAKAACLILEKNLYGMDIDEVAYRITSFALLVKAREYDEELFCHPPTLSLFLIKDSKGLIGKTKKEQDLINLFSIGQEVGSLIQPTDSDEEFVKNADLAALARSAKALSQNYDIVITNPPYLGKNGMSKALHSFVKDQYPKSKADLFACFIERCLRFAKKDGYVAMITQQAFLFLKSYESLRTKFFQYDILHLLHLDSRAFDDLEGEIVKTCAFVLRNSKTPGFVSLFSDLSAGWGPEEKKAAFINKENRYHCCCEDFSKLPLSPAAYWISPKLADCFRYPTLGTLASVRQGIACGNVGRFRREWYEVPEGEIYFHGISQEAFLRSGKKYVPINDGGPYRKWYGNNTAVLRFDQQAYEILSKSGNRLPSKEFYFKPGITWTAISSRLSLRYFPQGFLFSNAGMAVFAAPQEQLNLCALLNSCVASHLLLALNKSLNFNSGDLSRLPIHPKALSCPELRELAKDCIRICHNDWKESELSWKFSAPPLILMRNKDSSMLLSQIYKKLEKKKQAERKLLMEKEEKINEILISYYQLQGVLTPKVQDEDLSLQLPTKKKEAQALLSYLMGCALGRYSLSPSHDVVLFLTDETEGLTQKIIALLSDFFGEETLQENLYFLSNALEIKALSPTLALHRYLSKQFFKDHCKFYKNRPLYWQFVSGKKQAISGFFYYHHYDKRIFSLIEKQIFLQKRNYKKIMVEQKEKMNAKISLVELIGYEKKLPSLSIQLPSIDYKQGIVENYRRFLFFLRPF